MPGAARAGSAHEDRALERSPAAPSPEVLPWSAPSIRRSGSATAAIPDAVAATETETATPPRLPRRDPHATPVAIIGVVEVAESLRAFVAKEVQDVKDAVGRAVASRPPEAPRLASPTPSDDAVRKLMNRMRTMTQEERFRSGKLR